MWEVLKDIDAFLDCRAGSLAILFLLILTTTFASKMPLARTRGFFWATASIFILYLLGLPNTPMQYEHIGIALLLMVLWLEVYVFQLRQKSSSESTA